MLQNLCTNTKGNLCVETLPAAQEIESLIHAYGKLVFMTIHSLTGDWEESQDLTQDVFVKALQALDAARASSGVNFHAKAWLLRIALNLVRMQQRRRSLMRFIPFSRLREAQREEDDTDWRSFPRRCARPCCFLSWAASLRLKSQRCSTWERPPCGSDSHGPGSSSGASTRLKVEIPWSTMPPRWRVLVGRGGCLHAPRGCH